MSELMKVAGAGGQPRAHVIFVHGLGGDLGNSWRSQSDEAFYWPRWLFEDVDGLAVWSIGYDASISRWRGSAMHLPDRAANVLELLLARRDLEVGDVAFVGHSLGGWLSSSCCERLKFKREAEQIQRAFLSALERLRFWLRLTLVLTWRSGGIAYGS